MNRVVVLGAIIAVVVVAVIVAGILLANHQNNNYTPTFTTTNNGTNIIPNTMSINMTTDISYNTFYFLNKTGRYNYYIFVLSYKEYTQMMSDIPNAKIIYLVLTNQEVGITKTVVVGNYAFLIGYTFPLNVSIGQQYPIQIHTNFANIYTYWLTYEGNWTGPIP